MAKFKNLSGRKHFFKVDDVFKEVEVNEVFELPVRNPNRPGIVPFEEPNPVVVAPVAPVVVQHENPVLPSKRKSKSKK